MKRVIFFLLVLPLWWGYTSGQVSKNLSEAGFVGYQTLYNGQAIDPTQKETIADVAGWRDSRNGKEYAFVCLPTPGPIEGIGAGVAVVEVTNPSAPTYLKTIRRPGLNATNTPADVKVYDHFAFIAQNWQPTYWVDLTAAVDNPGNPSAGYQGDITTGMRIHNLFVNPEQKLLFLSRFTEGDSIRVYDISGVPNSAPVFKGEIPQLLPNAKSHDLYARKISSTEGLVFDASLRGITVTKYSWSNDTFTVVDQWVHQYNPRRGNRPSEFDDPPVILANKRNTHSTWVSASGNDLFSTEEQFGGSNQEPYWIPTADTAYQRGNYLYAWDISTIKPPADPDKYQYN